MYRGVTTENKARSVSAAARAEGENGANFGKKKKNGQRRVMTACEDTKSNSVPPSV